MLVKSHFNFQKLIIDSPKTLFIVKAILLSLLIAISAQISVPFWPVPLTLQPMAVLAIGFACPPHLALTSVIAYILEGAMGLPVFQGLAGGFYHLLGPTAGYIMGFLPLVAISSYFKGKEPTFGRLFKVGLLAKVPLFTLGVLWLSTFVSFDAALKLGFWPFLLKVPVEIAFAILSCHLAQTAFNHLSEKI